MELIEKDLDFVEELKEYKGSFEWDELFNIFFWGKIESILILIFFGKN
jgi:hypothetical protein